MQLWKTNFLRNNKKCFIQQSICSVTLMDHEPTMNSRVLKPQGAGYHKEMNLKCRLMALVM